MTAATMGMAQKTHPLVLLTGERGMMGNRPKIKDESKKMNST